MNKVADLIAKARGAQAQIASYTQEQINEVCVAVGWELYKDDNIETLARLAVEETGYGNVASKIIKHKRKVGGPLQDILDPKAISVGLMERDEATGISKYAKPVGVVCAILPATNPTATPGTNVIAILKGRNAVIFRPSSRARKASSLAVEYMREGLRKVGAPVDLVQCYDDADIPTTNELMAKCDLVLATGGGPMVRAAYSSGTPSYGVGTGNAVCIIAEDADAPDAVAKITASNTFDNATSCSSENSVIIHESLYDQVVAEFRKNNGYIVDGPERDQLFRWLWITNQKGKLALNPDIVAQSALKVATDAGLSVPPETTQLVVIGLEPAPLDKFSEEKLCPVLTLYKYATFDEALEKIVGITDRCGRGHSMGIHTFKREYIERMGREMLTSRISVRAPMAAANGGHATNGMPSTATLGCGTWGKNATTENIHWRHFINVTWVNEPIAAKDFSEQEIFGGLWAKYGK
jgi:sulfoacetaldehyde dehydrogenase